jgi:thiol-disulfide isomerase/thioredoxin
MRFRALILSLLLTGSAWAGIVDDVRIALARNNYSAAESELNTYRSSRGITGEYLDAYSWLARAALDQQQYDQSLAYAKQTRSLAAEYLKQHSVDSDPHLALGLGAAIEVQSQALSARDQRAQAIALLRSALQTYGRTSLRERLQKNLNLLSLQGRLAPPLRSDELLGPKPPSLVQLKGSPVLLFFWAHWCGDCKADAPIITQLRSEFASKGLTVIAPTRLYGYTAQIEHASASDEMMYVDAVRHRFYSGLLDIPMPVSKYNFETYGASTTPTLVLLDRAGKVAMYHPGAMSYGELRGEIEKVAAR